MAVTKDIPIGSTGTHSVEVSRELTVAHFHERMPEVYGTPMMIYLMEVAAAAAIDEYLPEGWVSVGATVDIKHIAPTPIGLTVTATARVISVSETSIEFIVQAEDGVELIGEGTHVRAPLELSRLEQRLQRKLATANK